MGSFFEGLGYRVCHENVNMTSSSSEVEAFCDKKILEYDMFQDMPWPSVYRRYIEQFDDIRFILTYRSLDKWLNSMSIFGSKRVPIHG